MRCRKIVFVFCVLILVSDASPWRPRRYRNSSQAVTTRRIVVYLGRNKTGNASACSVINAANTVLPATITPIDDNTAVKKKEAILHKAHKERDGSELVQPLEIDGVVIDGINDWFILDGHYGEFDFDEDFYEYYNEYIAEFFEEIVYEYEIDDFED